MILLRTSRVDATIEALADQFERASGEPVALLVDERGGVAKTERRKISLTRAACKALGLYLPPDFAWSCGDYGFYLARAQFPDETHFWMIEHDVRISGDAARFFAAWRARAKVDFVAAQIGPADSDWWWRPTVTAADAAPRRCFFPVVRLSARAIDLLGAKRRQHARRPFRRALWPNDEGFAATTAAAAGLTMADLNDAGERFYDAETFSYTNIIDGAHVAERQTGARLLHPVLAGDDLARKRERMQAETTKTLPLHERACRKLARLANGASKW